MIISVIIRTKNEEKWIEKCLQAIYNQKVNADIEVVLVDNNSSDHTIAIAKRYSVNKIINIENFIPGKALNDGIKVSSGDYIVCISAHCIPENNDWLKKMLSNFNNNSNIAGVYGRQIPMSFTNPIDKRDLLIVFGKDKRIQKKDYFFHNANSMIPRLIWEKFPFDENVTNIEDRVWGKQVIEEGYNIIYEPEATVFHHHGLHQGNQEKRAKGVVSILEKVDYQIMNSLPLLMRPEKINVAAIIPIIGDLPKGSYQYSLFKKAVDSLKSSRFINSIYCICENKNLAKSVDVIYLNRQTINNEDSISLNKLLMHALGIIESQGDYPDSIFYVNHDYLNRSKGIIDEIITYAQYNGCDSTFPGLIDYGHYWYNISEKEYKQTDTSLKPRGEREPLYKAMYGLGTLTSSWLIRSGRMVGGEIGIVKIEDDTFSERSQKSNGKK